MESSNSRPSGEFVADLLADCGDSQRFASERRVLSVVFNDELGAIQRVLGCTAIEHATTFCSEEQLVISGVFFLCMRYNTQANQEWDNTHMVLTDEHFDFDPYDSDDDYDWTTEYDGEDIRDEIEALLEFEADHD